MGQTASVIGRICNKTKHFKSDEWLNRVPVDNNQQTTTVKINEM